MMMPTLTGTADMDSAARRRPLRPNRIPLSPYLQNKQEKSSPPMLSGDEDLHSPRSNLPDFLLFFLLLIEQFLIIHQLTYRRVGIW